MLFQLFSIALSAESVLRVSVQQLRKKRGGSVHTFEMRRLFLAVQPTYPLDELLAVFADDATRELDFAKATARRAESALGLGCVALRRDRLLT